MKLKILFTVALIASTTAFSLPAYSCCDYLGDSNTYQLTRPGRYGDFFNVQEKIEQDIIQLNKDTKELECLTNNELAHSIIRVRR